MKKRVAVAVSIVAVMASAGAAAASPTPTGTYRTTITTPAAAKGTWTLDFKTNGSVTVSRNGQVTANHPSVKGSTLTAPGGENCHTVGTYLIKLAGNTLTFTVIKDTCKVGRKLILPRHTWTKVS
jgi:hypothetical protein